jgi:hypothetical protein
MKIVLVYVLVENATLKTTGQYIVYSNRSRKSKICKGENMKSAVVEKVPHAFIVVEGVILPEAST